MKTGKVLRVSAKDNKQVREYIEAVKKGRETIRRLIREGKLSKNPTIGEISEALEAEKTTG
jgi:hypothetical protein